MKPLEHGESMYTAKVIMWRKNEMEGNSEVQASYLF